MLKIQDLAKRYFDKDYFKIGAAGQIKVRSVNRQLFISGGACAIIILFYLILFSTTNYLKLGKFEDYALEYTLGDCPTKFNKINLGIKIMPSYNLEKNILYMNHTLNPLKSIIYDSSPLAISYGIEPDYFRTDQTYNIFPKFSFKKENIPLGNSIALCLTIHWGELERGKHYHVMKNVQGFSKCSTANEQFIWNEEDSIYGVDIPAWVQIINEAECKNDEECADYCKEKFGGAYIKGKNKNKCYSYQILHGICLVLKYNPLKDEYSFHGGCYPNNETYRLVPGIYGEEVDFNDLKIEVREYSDPIIQAGEWTNYRYRFGQYWRYVSFVFKFLLLITLGVLAYVSYDVYKTRLKFRGAPNLISNEENSGMPGNFGF